MGRIENIAYIENVLTRTQQCLDEGYLVFWDEELVPYTHIDGDMMLGNICLVYSDDRYVDLADEPLADIKVQLRMRLRIMKEIVFSDLTYDLK